jgi:hypothetical protein
MVGEPARSEHDSVPRPSAAPLSGRAIWLSVLTSAIIGFSFPWAELVVRGSRPANTSLPFGIVALFFILVAIVNPVLKLISRRLGLTRADMLVIFMAALLASSVVTWGLVGQLLPIMTGVSYYGTPENHWQELIGERSVEWLGVSEEITTRQFYEATRAGEGVPWEPWMLPLGMWAIFTAAMAATTLGLMVLVHRQWIEHERLVYPLMWLPVEMVAGEERSSLWPALLRNRLFWIGALIAIIPSVFIGLRHYYPVVPELHLRFETLIPLQRERVLMRLWTNFAVVAFSYLINADLSFSLWFFALVSAFQTPVFRLMGISVGAKEVYSSGSLAVSNQAMGAMFFLVGASLWAARGDIARGFRTLVGARGSGVHEPDSIAATGAAALAIGLIGMTWWLTASGLSFIASVLLIIAAFVTFIALTRAAVQGGVPVSRAALIPQSFVLHALGSTAIGPAGIASLAYSFAWSADIRVFLMPFAAHGIKIWTDAGVRRRGFLPLAAIVLVIALVVSTVTTMTLAYAHGGVTLSSWLFGGCPRAAFTYAAASLQNPVEPSLSWWLWMVAGGLIMSGLTALHMRFVGWPLHPLGFAIAPTQPVQDLWFSILLGWLSKWLVLRYGGFRVYDRGTRVMLGLILGQALACAGFLIADAITGTTGNMLYVY